MYSNNYYRNGHRNYPIASPDRNSYERNSNRNPYDSAYGPDYENDDSEQNYSFNKSSNRYPESAYDRYKNNYYDRNNRGSDSNQRNSYSTSRNFNNRNSSTYNNRGGQRNYFGFPGRPYEYDDRNEGYFGRNSSDYLNDYDDGRYYSTDKDLHEETNRNRNPNNAYSGEAGRNERNYFNEVNPFNEEEKEYGRDYEDTYFDKQEARGRRGVDNEDTSDFYPYERERRQSTYGEW
jgi:hypothetical protein